MKTPPLAALTVARAVRRRLQTERAFGRQGWPRRKRPAITTASSKVERMALVAQEAAACQRCPLHRTRTHVVVGEGSLEARLVFVGEAPGHDEDQQGRPFVGRAGQLLTKMIAAMGLAREHVYIANVLKDRPPGNRTPLPEEMAACLPLLTAQLEIIQPRVICALGAVAARALLSTEASLGSLRGRFHQYRGIPVMPTYHPAYLLRNPDAKRVVWEDLKHVRDLLSTTHPA